MEDIMYIALMLAMAILVGGLMSDALEILFEEDEEV